MLKYRCPWLVSRVGLLVGIAAIHCDIPLYAENEKETKKELPRIALCAPLAVMPNATTKIIVRGWRLSDATEVRVASGKIAAKILSKGTAAVLERYDPKRIGDQQVEIEATVPSDFSSKEVSVVVVGPSGESPPYTLLVGGEFPVIAEKEPNDGFRQAQRISLPQIVDGAIHANQNVDVFSWEGRANEKIVAEIFAARHGSVLDGTLTLHDERGSLVAFADDLPDSLDPRLEATLPTTGVYFLTVLDSHDRGSTFHGYRLIVRKGEQSP